MDRRDFLKIASCTGLSVVAPTAFGGPGVASKPRVSFEPYTGTLVVTVSAGGGWDPTSFCDPKGAKSESDPNPMNGSYLSEEIATAGNIRYAPLPFTSLYQDTANQQMLTYDMTTFFEKYYQRLTVINGMDVMTNGHDEGQRTTFSGRLAEGHPSFAAFAAGAFGKEQPMAYLAFGGYAETAGIAPRVRAGGDTVGVLSRLAYPTRQDPMDENSGFHHQKVQELIDASQAGRDQALATNQGLPKIRNAINAMFTARSGSNELKRLQEFLPPADQLQNGLKGQAQIVCAAYKAGICISAGLETGGFDTHGNHDQDHIPNLLNLLEGVDFLMDEAERQGIADKIMVIVGSDFGRTPYYNGGNGKDHWNVSSMMIMGPGIPGNRVIGTTNEEHQAIGVTTSLTADTSETARRIHPGDVHYALRRVLGLEGSELDAMFPLDLEGDPLPLFG
ncbi:MAG TPA: DUF1501 domain-containing protein [Nannocystaceae bacterium]|nr:DUF1501 domain-containing protein [Nannocystaceae bacterium]